MPDQWNQLETLKTRTGVPYNISVTFFRFQYKTRPATLAATVVAACAAVVGTRLLLRWRQRLREEQEAFSAQPFNGAVTLAATAPAALLPAATVGLDRLERLR